MDNLKKFLNEKQDPNAVKKIYGKVSELLTKSEQIEYIAVQKKPAINISPDCIALTNKRIIFCRPKSFGLSMQFDDFLWKEIYDCHIKEGVFGTKFFVKTISKRIYFLDYLPKVQARLLYRYAQEREEEMTEYRRERELENKRAAAGGGVYVNTTDNEKNKTENTAEDPLKSLKKLKELLEHELISETEFNIKRANILKDI